MEGIVRKRRRNQLPISGVGYIIIPNDVEKEAYIDSCYKRERVCILLDQGSSMVKDCYITKQALRDLIEPQLGRVRCKKVDLMLYSLKF